MILICFHFDSCFHLLIAQTWMFTLQVFVLYLFIYLFIFVDILTFIFMLQHRDVVSGLVHLHELGIIHRDLKPQNVLITKERSLCAKLSDMGISKRLLEDMSSLGHSATGACLYP